MNKDKSIKALADIGLTSQVDENMDINGDYVHIVFGDKCISKIYSWEMEEIFTLKTAFDIAVENGYKNGTILVINETGLSGQIYRYNNYHNKEWMLIGQMGGYA